MNLIGLKTLKIYIQREDPLKDLNCLILKWLRETLKCVLIKRCRHNLEVSTHEGSRYNSENEVLTRGLEELTHMDSRQSKTKVSTHRVEESTHVDSEQIWNVRY